MGYDYLAHYGTKGMKWGVRKYQNEDGSLTPEGRKRYGVGERNADTKFKKSDVYAMEGAKRGGLLGAAVGKAVGVYKERKERKQDPDRLTKDERKVFDDAKKLEDESIYDFSVNNRSKPLAQRVKDTENQLQSVCEKHLDRLTEAVKNIPGYSPSDSADALHKGSLAKQLAYRMNERFDADHILDQHMDEYVLDYRKGRISQKEFKQHYETELNDYAAWVVDTFDTEELKKVANTFSNEQGNTSLNTGWRDYLKTVDSWDGLDSTAMNRQNSKKSSQYAVKNPPKSSGRYTTGSKIDKSAERQMISRAKSLRNSGKTIAEVAEVLGIPASTAADYIYY